MDDDVDWSEIDDNLLDPAFHATGEYHAAFRRLRDEDPVHWTRDARFGKDYWAVTRYDDVKAVLLDHERFSSRWNTRVPRSPARLTPEERYEMLFDTTISFLDEPMHSLYRRPINKHFSAPAIAKMGGWIDEISDEIIADVGEQGECDLVDDLAAELPVRVILRMLGVPEEDWPMIRLAASQFLAASDPRFLIDGDQAATSRMGLATLAEYCGKLALARRDEPRDDFATLIGDLEIDGDRLSIHEMQSWFVTMISGGLETTRNGVSVGIWLFLEHPEQRRKLLADPSLTASAVEEILRWGSPAKNRLRIANSALDFGGRSMKAGDWVVAFQVSANRDERRFAEPDVFDITREDNDHLSLGAGIHLCLGRYLARLELATFLPKLLTAFPDLHRAEEGPERWLADAQASGFSEMKVAFTPTRPAVPV